MTTLTLHAPGEAEPVHEALREGEVLLVGRRPSRDDVPEPTLPPGTIRELTLASRRVSATHLAAWRDGATLCLRDLHSRNGTVLHAPADAVVRVDTDALTVELAAQATPTPTDHPAPASWSSEDDFAEAVAREVNRWLAARRVGVKAVARDRRPMEGSTVAPIPLGAGRALHLIDDAPGGTVDALWGDGMDTLVGYVHEQRARLESERGGHDGELALSSAVMRDAHARVVDATARGLPLILLGETGAGKGTLARCYHLHGERRARTFESVNCAEVDKHFARTRLFGARRGAYTGCVADIAGAVECARGGTLFLDELAELPVDVQGELLTFLDDGRYKRLGDDQWREADVRVVCGTSADLRRAVREGRFRADLWYRLAGRTVVVPGLRDRPEDIVAYLQRRGISEDAGATRAWDALSVEARRLCVEEHPWRGNFRELESFIRRLPRDAAPGAVSREAALAAIREGTPEEAPAAPLHHAWRELAAVAATLYGQRNAGREPARASEFRDYVEEVLKPMFFAKALGQEHLDALPERPSPSFEEMARRLGCDAATVKHQLARYVELRRGSRPE